MSLFEAPQFLRRVLLADAVISGATGLLLMLGAGLIEPHTGLPAALLRYAGSSLLPFAAIVCYLGLRATIPTAAVWAVIVYNALWTVDSLVLLATGWIAPTALGYAFVIAQAVAVGALAELQYVGLRQRSRASVA